MNDSDWTQGGDHLWVQQCQRCRHRWYFRRDFCPQCGHDAPRGRAAAGRGTVHASTLVHRAPSDEFRALAPYRIVLVDLEEGARVMGHADPGVAIDDPVRCEIRTLAGRRLPYFVKESDVA